jgi:glutathione synthase/RimK-type ligase-like ATP-grasp enzyme
MLRIALATSLDELPPSDKLLAAALTAKGFDVRAAIWSNAQVPWQEFDAVIIRSCWDYHLRAAEFLQWINFLQQSGIALINSPDLIRWNSDKIYLAELIAAGIATPDTVFLNAGEQLDLAALCAVRNWPAAVVKPRISASAYRTERRSSGVASGPAVVQRYISAVENTGEWSLVHFNGEFSHAVIKKPRAGDFRVQQELGGTAEIAQPPDAALKFAAAVLSRLPSPAIFARVDVIADRNEIFLMELEVIEPELFLDLSPGSADALASVVASHLQNLFGKRPHSKAY